jgi:hypothetical protein
MMLNFKCLWLIFSVLFISNISAFTTQQASHARSVSMIDKRSLGKRLSQYYTTNSRLNSNIKIEDNVSIDSDAITSVSWPYAAAWIGFVAFAFLGTPHEGIGGEGSKELIEKFIQNPLNPGINHIFNYIFNLFAWIPFSLSALLMPGAKRQSVPATPFLLGSTLIGYMSLGM